MRALAYISALIGLASAAAVDLQPRQTSSTACNNSPALCSKPYNQITHLGAHDSPFVRDASTGYSSSGNQYYNSTVQLSAGVRLLSAQIHKSNGAWHLCHSSCDLLDAGLLSSWLKEIKTWLDANPDEVVTLLLVNSDNATPSDLAAQFSDSQITSYAYKPASKSSPPATWPTLHELIAANTRLVVFVASLSSDSITDSESYLMDEFTFIFENPYDNTAFTDFTCTPDRPSAVKGNTEAAISSNRMPLMNHFLYSQGLFSIETPDIGNISTTNSKDTTIVGSLGQSASSCTSIYGKQPTFVLVDFFDQGAPAIAVVDSLNGVTSPVGRTAVPARNVNENSSDRSSTTFQGIKDLVTQVQEGQAPKLGAWIWGAGKWTWGGINVNGGSVLS